MLSFRQAVAGWYERRFGVSCDPETEVIALIGSKEGNHHLCLAVLNPGDVAVLPDPGYPAYYASAVFAGAEVLRLPIRRQDGYLPRFEDIPSDSLKRTRLIFLSYPNNPTGAVATAEFYQRAVDFARQHDLVVVNDNPYAEIYLDDFRPPSIMAADGAHDVAVELNSLSKPFNMTGWRLGMAVGAPHLIAAMSQVKENTDSGVFNAIQYAGIAALEGPTDDLEALRVLYRHRRDLVIETLRAIGLDPDPPKATFYVWCPTPNGMLSMDYAAEVLDRAGVVITPGVGYGSQGEGFFRISLTVPDARLEEAARRLRQTYRRS